MKYKTGYVKLVVPSTKRKFYKAAFFITRTAFRELRQVFIRATDADNYALAVSDRYQSKLRCVPSKQEVAPIKPSEATENIPDWQALAGFVE